MITIYKIKIKSTDRCYVGVTNNPKRRESQHRFGAKYELENRKGMYLDWGKDTLETNYEFSILEQFDFVSNDHGWDKEEYWIKKYNAYTKGYNSTPRNSKFENSPIKGRKMSDEARKNISKNHWCNGRMLNNPAAKTYILECEDGNIEYLRTRTQIADFIEKSITTVKRMIASKEWTKLKYGTDYSRFKIIDVVDESYEDFLSR